MASVNKASLREEFDTLKARFEGLCADGKVPSESRALFEALLMLFELLMAVFMEKRTTKDSTNSSKPSSQTSKDETALTRSGTHGKGKAQNDLRSGNTRTVESVQVAEINACERCGEDLSGTPCQGRERRTKIDIIFEKVVSHVDAEIKHCPQCQAQTKGRFPQDMPGPRPRDQSLCPAPTDRPDALAQAGATIDHNADRKSDFRSDNPELRHAAASGFGGLGALGRRANPGPALDACR
jgi:hypothetical protein